MATSAEGEAAETEARIEDERAMRLPGLRELVRMTGSVSGCVLLLLTLSWCEAGKMDMSYEPLRCLPVGSGIGIQIPQSKLYLSECKI